MKLLQTSRDVQCMSYSRPASFQTKQLSDISTAKSFFRTMMRQTTAPDSNHRSFKHKSPQQRLPSCRTYTVRPVSVRKPPDQQPRKHMTVASVC